MVWSSLNTDLFIGSPAGPTTPKRRPLPDRDAAGARGDGSGGPEGNPWWTEPDVGRVADGVPSRVDRLAALGNALLPQIAEWVGCRIIEYERGEEALS